MGVLTIIYFNAFAYTAYQTPAKDTGNRSQSTQTLIQKIISQNNLPTETQAAAIDQITRYGFRNLFNDYGYNANLPYKNQINPKAEFFMASYLRNHRKQLLELKDYSLPYFKLIEHILRQYGLPPELKYLAVIESHLKTSATSHAGAAGPWQFMPETGRNYGLKITPSIDERRDFFKSTHAAARFLLKLFKEFNDWLLVIAAYNGGEGRVYQAIQKAEDRNFWNLQYYLPEESRNHVKKFIATHYLMENEIKETVDRSTSTLQSPIGERNISEKEIGGLAATTISGKYSAAIIASSLEMKEKEFDRLNPNLDFQMEKNGKYDLLLPEPQMNIFLEKKYEILQACVNSLLEPAPFPAPKTIKN